jgi:hypothetical protein
MSRGFVPLLENLPSPSSFTYEGFATSEEALTYLENLLQILELHTRLNFNSKPFIMNLQRKIMYVMGSIVITYCKADDLSNRFKKAFVVLLNRFALHLKGEEVQRDLQVYFTRRILTVSNIDWLLEAINNHLDLFYFNQTDNVIALRAGLSTNVITFVTKLVDVSEAIQRGEMPMKVIDVDESDVDESEPDTL